MEFERDDIPDVIQPGSSVSNLDAARLLLNSQIYKASPFLETNMSLSRSLQAGCLFIGPRYGNVNGYNNGGITLT